MLKRQDTPYVWVKTAARYRDVKTGRFIKTSVVKDWSEKSIEKAQGVVSNAAAGASDNPSAWYATMRQEIKSQVIVQYLTGIGGRNNMTQADWGRAGGIIADQYRYLEGFYAEVQAGTLTEEQIAMRSRMYINSAREALAKSSEKAHKVAEYTKKVWVLGAKEHCEDCLYLAALGEISIDDVFESPSGGEAWPGSGNTKCLTNCGCSIEYIK